MEIGEEYVRQASMNMELLCKTAFEYYPFGVIFSKKSPSDIATINFDTDFCYFYFSPHFEQLSLLKRLDMCDGKTNAKTHFPDYRAYFKDDAVVMNHYTNGKVLAICEPWAPQGIHSYVYTRKTALLSNGAAYMLGCFDLVDDILLGIATFKQIPHDAYATVSSMSVLPISNSWFYDAFNALPNGMAIIREDGMLLCFNKAWDTGEIVYGTDNREIGNRELVNKIRGLFNDHGFVTSNAHSLAQAAWLSKVFKTSTDQHYDVGIYGIQCRKKIFQVLVLRPTMDSVTTPYWHAEMKDNV